MISKHVFLPNRGIEGWGTLNLLLFWNWEKAGVAGESGSNLRKKKASFKVFKGFSKEYFFQSWLFASRSNAGTISSFNNNNGLGQELINHNYPICINQVDGYCDVALTASSFDLDGTAPACNDKLVLGANTYCGSTFGTASALTCK